MKMCLRAVLFIGKKGMRGHRCEDLEAYLALIMETGSAFNSRRR